MSILIVSGIEGIRNCAEVVSKQLATKVEFAEGRRGALEALRRRDFAIVVVDQTLAECDPAAADAIWDRSGLAIPLQINFALSGTARITGNANRQWLSWRRLKQSMSKCETRFLGCCCIRNSPSHRREYHAKLPKSCAWLPILPALCASTSLRHRRPIQPSRRRATEISPTTIA